MVAIPGGHKAEPPKKKAYVDGADANPRLSFMQELERAGFTGLPSLPVLDRITRCDAPGDKRGKQSGWFWYQEVSDDWLEGATIGIGVYGTWKDPDGKTVWTSKRREKMSVAEQQRLDEQMRAARIAREREQERLNAEAAVRAKAIWDAAFAAPDDHPYLVRKMIGAHGIGISEGSLVVPVFSATEGTTSLQFIQPDGSKKFLRHGKVKSGYCELPGKVGPIYIVEGFATGATILEATGNMVFIAFNAGNLCDVAAIVRQKYPDTEIIIAGDDDIATVGNPGRTKAMEAAQLVSGRAIFPALDGAGTDWNDLHVASGLDAVRSQLASPVEVYRKEPPKSSSLPRPPGILACIVDYYNATARVPQPGFAIQAAIAIGSIVCARNYRTDRDNFSPIFLLNIAKSGTGKDHAKKVVERVLASADQSHLIVGQGYTSNGAVMSALLRLPRHVTIIDEFGRYMEVAKSGRNTNLYEANSQLMQVWGSADGEIRPQSYSTMTLSADKAAEFASRKIVNPCITLLAMSTPSNLFATLGLEAITGGFLPRILMSISDQERQLHAEPRSLPVPEVITTWIRALDLRANRDAQELPGEPPIYQTLQFTRLAEVVFVEMEEKILAEQNRLEAQGLADLLGRAKEMAMRLSMIAALADNHEAVMIEEPHAHWACEYVWAAMLEAIRVVRMNISGSEFEADKKEILQAFRDAGENGYAESEMPKTPPFSKHKPRDLKDMVKQLADAELIAQATRPSGPKGGRPRAVWIATK